MNQKIRILNRTLWVLGTALALTLGMSSIASADTPVWDDEYGGTVVTKFKVKSCGQVRDTGGVVVNLWGPDNNDGGYLHEYGTWGIAVGPDSVDRFAGTINSTSRNGKKLYLSFFPGSREKVDLALDDLKHELCEVAALPDDVTFTQLVMKTNKLGTVVQTNLRAKYGAIVNEGGRLKPAQWSFTGKAYTDY